MTRITARLRPHERLKDPAAFRKAFERRLWASDGVLTVHGIENGRDASRLGISVSRRKVRAASTRNRLKRLIREAFRLSKADLPAGIDLVVVPRAHHPSFAAVQQSLVALARHLARRLRNSRQSPSSPPPGEPGAGPPA
jgi:ribonuclease P protein component